MLIFPLNRYMYRAEALPSTYFVTVPSEEGVKRVSCGCKKSYGHCYHKQCCKKKYYKKKCYYKPVYKYDCHSYKKGYGGGYGHDCAIFPDRFAP